VYRKDPANQPYMNLQFSSALTTAGTSTLLTSSYECQNCFPYRLISMGSVVSSSDTVSGDVPEPATLALLGAAMAGFMGRRKRHAG